jgi:hypothetical protein
MGMFNPDKDEEKSFGPLPQPRQIGDGGPAFPSGDGQAGGGPNHYYGMRLRDWFAGQVLAGSARQFDKPSGAAKWAYDVAEAMLKERERT